jgi:hypothetical protein
MATEDASAFVAKWRGAWPEWGIVDGFVPAPERSLAHAWSALQFELQEAAWGGADARPGEAKLAWWGEELAGWAQGRRRHPLGAVLQRGPAPWARLANALPALAGARARPADGDDAWAQLADVATATASVESALLGGLDGTDAAEAVAAAWLHARLARHPRDAVPVDHPDARTWAGTLARRWPGSRGLSASRRIELAIARARLARGDASAALGPFAALWTGWRAARR